MKRIVTSLLGALFLLGASASAAPKHDPNPTRDPDVQRGYDQHQKEYRERETKETYTVHKSGEGHGGEPTSGAFDDHLSKH